MNPRAAVAVAVAGWGGCARAPVPLDHEDSPPRSPQIVSAVDVALEAHAQDWDLGETFKHGRGCTVGDMDLDGLLDVVLANPSDRSYVLLNASTPGHLSFRPGPVLSDGGLPWGYAAADVDGDGDLDLAAANGGLEGRELDQLLTNRAADDGNIGFDDVTKASGIGGPYDVHGLQRPTASVDAQWVDVDLDGDLDLYVDASQWPGIWNDPPEHGVGGRNQLWIALGGGRYEDRAIVAGLDRLASSRFGSWLDVDGDGDLDLHENAMTPSQSVTWRNDLAAPGADIVVFNQVAAGWGLGGSDPEYPPESFVSAAADFNNDGWDDLIKFSRGWPSAGPHLLGHTLFLNAHGLGFVDVTALSNLNDPFLDGGLRDHEGPNGVMGATARDLNGDGLPDVILGNGGPSAGYPNGLFLTTGLEPVDFGGAIGVLWVPMFENRSELIDVPAEVDPREPVWPPYPYRTHALCVADFDEDGRPDLLVRNGGMRFVGGEAAREPSQLFTFAYDVPPRFLKVRLHGDGVAVPYTPVGSKIAVFVGDDDGRSWVVRDTLRTIEGFAAQHGELRWFGLADATHVDRVEVRWTDGTTVNMGDVDLDSTIDVWR